MKLDNRYADYFSEYSNYFGRALILLKSVYGMTNSGKLFSDELIEWLLEKGFIQYQCHMYIYYKYAPNGTKKIVLSYVDDFVYCYTYEYIVNVFEDNLENRFHVNFLGYAHLCMSIRISQVNNHSISVDQARYANFIVAKYLDTVTVKESKNIYKTNFPYDMIFSKADASTSGEKVYRLTRGLNIHYRACNGSLIYLLSTRVYLSFEVHKLTRFSSNPGKVHFQGLLHLLRYIRYNNNLVLNYFADINDAPVSELLIKSSINTENQLMASYDSSS